MNEIILYDAANSPCGRRVRMCLLEKGLNFEIRWLNIGLMDQKQSWYLKLNPNGLVPTLVHDGKAIYESNVINEYLDAIFPEPQLMSDDPHQQAEIRQWVAFEQEWAKSFRDAIYETLGKERLQSSGFDVNSLDVEIRKRTDNPFYAKFVRRVLTEPKNEELLSDRHMVLLEKMTLMEERLADNREWLVGDRFSLADIALAPRIDMFPMIDIDDLYDRFPRIGAFMQRLSARPSWRDSAIFPEQGQSSSQVSPAA